MALTQPKRPVGGAFGIFANEKRADFQKACVGKPVSAVSQMAGTEWKKLGDKEREPYQKRYETAKAQFEKDMAAFLESGGEKSKGLRATRAEKKRAKDGKKKKDKDAPKRPAGGAYGQFLNSNRENIKKLLPADHKITDVTKKAGEMFKALSAEDRQKYESMYQEANEQFKKAIDEYKANKPEEPGTPTASPKKRKADSASKAAKPAKRGRVSASAKKTTTVAGIDLDDEILEQARQAGFESALKNLACRTDVVSSGKKGAELLQALKASEGLVNKAKAALLGA